MKEIRGQIEGFPGYLRSILPKIDEAISQPPLQIYQQTMPAQIGDIFMPADITTFDFAVRWYIGAWFHELVNRLRDEVVTPIIRKKEELAAPDDIDLQDIARKGIENIQKYLDDVMKDNPDFWHRYAGPGGKEEVSYGLQNEVKKSFGLVEWKITTLMEKLDGTAKEQEVILVKTENDMKALQGYKEKLDARLDSLESPFGRIPADLPDLIKLFPILMVGLIVFVTAILRKSNNLYTALREEYKKNTDEIEVQVFQRQLDCWFLPPYKSIFQPLILGCCFAIMIGLFIRASFLVVTEPDLFVPVASSDVNSLRRNILISAYLFGAVVIVGCLYLIGRIVRGDDSHPNTKNV